MANKEQLEILMSSVEAWNEWREANPDEAVDLRHANLRDAHFTDAHLTDALSGANLSGANLSGANLSGANLSSVDLGDADLSGANLRGANLTGADLRGANLRGADLRGANLYGNDLRGANLSNAAVGAYHLAEGPFLTAVTTALGDLDLSATRGLADVKYFGPSTIGTSTLERTAAGLAKDASRHGEIEAFYRGAGVEEHLIEHYRSRIGMPIEFYSCFISYSHSDKPFARRLYADLQAAGIRCWLDEKEIRGGDLILDVVNQAIRRHDKLILCCSLASLTSSWVEDEVAAAIERERKYEERILIPVDLDGYLFDGYEGRFGPRLRERFAIPFEGWSKDAAKLEAGLEAAINALRPRAEDPEG